MGAMRSIVRRARPLVALALLGCGGGAGPVFADSDTIALEQGHRALWQQLRSAAEATAQAIDLGDDSDPAHAAAFRALAGFGDGLHRQIVDPYGDVVAWSGPGLLHEVVESAPANDACGVVESAASATLWCRGPAQSGAGEAYVVVGRSFERAGPPPLDGASRERFEVDAWSLAPGDGESPTRLVARGLRPRSTIPFTASTRIAAALGALLGLLAIRRRGTSPPLWLVAVVAALAGLAVGAAAVPASIAAAAIVLALAAQRAASERIGVWAPIVAAMAGPLLSWVWQQLPPALVASAEPSIFAAPDLLAARVAATALLFAALLSAARRRANGDRGAWLLLPVGLLLLVGAVGSAAHLPSMALLALAAVLLAAGCRSLGAERTGVRAAVWLAAALVAASAGQIAEQRALPEEAAARAEALLPPPSLAASIEPIERRLTQATEEVMAVSPPSARPPADLAFAIWRRSPLARIDARSALAISRAGRVVSIFSFGLPVDAVGRLDAAPARWVELEPAVWRARALAGEVGVEVGGDDWRLAWALSPRPGFGEPAPPVGELAVGLLRDDAAFGVRGVRGGPPGRFAAAIYSSSGETLLTPWSEGGPRLDRRWLGEPRHAPVVATPDGSARVVARERDGVVVALFVPHRRLAAAFERIGEFAAGALVVLGLGALIGLVAVFGPLGLASALRRGLRSYSQRLLVVFSAFVLVPALALSFVLTGALERRLERDQENRALGAMRSAQRVLGEYVLALEPGFGVDTALDDRLLEWLARVVRHEVHLYWGSELYATSKRELFSSGLAPVRIPGEVWERLALGGEPLALRTASAGGRDYLEQYAPLVIPGEAARQTQLVLALPLLAQQEELAAEIGRVRRRVFLGALGCFGLMVASGAAFASSFARPIRELVAGTQRIAEGSRSLGVRPRALELESLADAIDRMAERIAEGRARLVAEKALVERIVENVTAAIVALDRDGNVLLANRFARERLDARPGVRFVDGLGAGPQRALRAAFESAAPGVEAVTERAAGEGGRDWTLVRLPLEGDAPAELVVIEDVTDVARAQRLEAWAGMARIIAHEIKNPLTPIRLSTEHLREAWARDREHFATVFERATANILVQVEELRQTASEFSLYAEIPQSEKVDGDLVEVVAEVAEGYRLAPPAGIEVVFRAAGEPIVGRFDRRLVGRAVRNLIENALRAQPEGGEVEIEVRAVGGRAEIRVADRGPGVPVERLDRILEPYFSTRAGGTGLGLPIARRVATEHGGDLEVRNRDGGGFEVTITMPTR